MERFALPLFCLWARKGWRRKQSSLVRLSLPHYSRKSIPENLSTALVRIIYKVSDSSMILCMLSLLLLQVQW